MDSSERLEELRKEMRFQNLDAFLVPSGDSHQVYQELRQRENLLIKLDFLITYQSAYISPVDKRLKWISGFAGSSGFAVVTQEKAALWSDGRHVDGIWTISES